MSNQIKKRRGRPPSSPLIRDTTVSFRLNSKEVCALESYAERYDQGISDVIRDALSLLSIIPDNPLRTFE